MPADFQVNPKRKYLHINQREAVVKFANVKKQSKFSNAISFLPTNTPQRPSLANLKKITLKDMDPTKDQVYDGCVLEARIIDWPIGVHGIMVLIEDENGDVER